MIAPSKRDVAVAMTGAAVGVAASALVIATTPIDDIRTLVMVTAAAFAVMCATMIMRDWVRSRREEQQ